MRVTKPSVNPLIAVASANDEGSVTVTYKEFNQSREHFNQEFPKLIKDALVKCDNEIDFTIIPHFKLGLPRSFTHENKIDFIKKQIIK